MRMMIVLLLGFGLALVATERAAAQGATCRGLASRGPLWRGCCAKSYARQHAETMSRKQRMAEIERCVTNGDKL